MEIENTLVVAQSWGQDAGKKGEMTANGYMISFRGRIKIDYGDGCTIV